MSPTSPAYYGGGGEGEVQNGGLMLPATFPFRVQSKPPKAPKKLSVAALKVCGDSHRIRKPPRPLPQVQYRAPVIIHTYSPKVIHTDPDDFMSLVQQLTGSSDTCLCLKRKPKKSGARKSPKPAPPASDLDLRQGDCGSPSSSEDSDFVSTSSGSGSRLGSGSGETKCVKQSNSPRGPLSNFEFDSKAVKAEQFESSFSFFTRLKLLPKPKPVPVPVPKPVPGGETGCNPAYHGIDINSPLPSPGFFSPGWLSELSPGTAAWSQAFLDCLHGSPCLMEQPPLPQQKAHCSSPNPSEMVTLENIQAFMMK